MSYYRLMYTRRKFIELLKNVFLISAMSPFLKACTSTGNMNRKLSPNNRIVIIGSGATALCFGALAAKNGLNVTVLEQHDKLVGGHARALTINGSQFCAGPQYVWHFNGNTTDIGTNTLKYLGLFDDNPFISLDKNGFDRVFIGSNAGIDIPIGLDRFKTVLIQNFPQEDENISALFYDLILLHNVSVFLATKGLNSGSIYDMSLAVLFSSKFSFIEKYKILFLSHKTVKDLFDKHSISKKCRSLLYGNSAIFAENMDSLSAGIFSAAIGNYHQGATFPKKGFEYLFNSLVKVIEENNGKVLLNKEVVKMVVSNNKVTSAQCKDGTSYDGDLFLSNLAPRLTFSLLDCCNDYLIDYEPSNSLLCTFISVKGFDVHKKMYGKNFWWNQFSEEIDFDSPDMTKPPSMLYACSSSSNIYTNQSSNLGQTLTVFSPGTYKQSKQYALKGKFAYDQFKRTCSQMVLEKLNQVFFPGIKNATLNVHSLTPFDIYHEIGAELGNVYGKKLDVKNIKNVFRPSQKCENLHVACATTSQPGIATAFQTSTLLAEKLLGIQIAPR